jgi:serine protease Do
MLALDRSTVKPDYTGDPIFRSLAVVDNASETRPASAFVTNARMTRSFLKPFLAGTLGACVGASSMMLVMASFTPAQGREAATNIAYASGENDEQRIVAAVKHVEPSVVALDVSINGTRIAPADQFGSPFGSDGGGGAGRLTPFQEQASGSGFVYSDSGLIITNDHVVHGASKITVVFANGDRIGGHIFSENSAADLALVKVDHYAKLPAPVEFGSSRAVQQGEWAIAIGEPLELKQTVTLGVVSGFNRDETIGGENAGGTQQFKGMLQTSAPINPGNSGGPLIDLDGRVIGVNQSVERPAQGIGFAIPADTVKTTVADLAGHPGGDTVASSAGFLGVQIEPLDQDLRSQLGYSGDGAVIAAVVGGSPADKAGLQPGDVIQSVDHKPVRTAGDVTSIVHGIAPGKTAAIDVWRNGTRQFVAVQVGSQPDQSG